MHLAKKFKSVCKDRLQALKEEDDGSERSKETEDKIDHYSLLLMDCAGHCQGGPSKQNGKITCSPHHHD